VHLLETFIRNLIEDARYRKPQAVDTVACAPNDGWRYHPKHAEQFPDINKLCNVASCWIYSRIRLGNFAKCL
jgi:hypothetical protein